METVRHALEKEVAYHPINDFRGAHRRLDRLTSGGGES